MKPYSAPQRTCIACGTKGEQTSFLRVALNCELIPTVVEKLPAYGRSAYVCCNDACVDGAFKKTRLPRALRLTLSEESLAGIHHDLRCKLKRNQET